MNSSDRILIETFEERFQWVKEKSLPIALYGIGAKTLLLLENISGLNIIGLMDRDTVGKMIYGHRILSYEEVISTVSVVIVVANLTVTDIIYQRISFLEDHGIRIFRINGSEFALASEDNSALACFENSLFFLQEQVDSHDVISFDVFDTLLMRRVLVPPDIFDLVEEELFSRFGRRFDFKARRIEAEHYCFHNISRYYTINDIYRRMNDVLGIPPEVLGSILDIELDMEIRNCVPRVILVNALDYANKRGKLVCITTDTYFREDFVRLLLKSCGISFFEHLHVSCEMKASKADSTMWQRFRDIYQGKRVLHVGDNELSDIRNARESGISVFETKSAVSLMELSSLRTLSSFVDRCDCRMILGQLFARLLNDPFVFHRTSGKLRINSMFDIGFLSFGPLVLDYLIWLIQISKEHRIEKLLFFARDGYLLLDLYRKIASKSGLSVPKGIYFLTSRRASSVAAIIDEHDIAFVINHMCNVKKTTVLQVLQTAFDINPESDDPFLSRSFYEVTKDEVVDYIVWNHGEAILTNARLERENYQTYIRSIGISADDRLGCINYVGRGVTQKCVSRILDQDIYGYYFATESNISDIMSSLDMVFALYGSQVHPYMGNSPFIDKYLLGEVILSSPEEQVIKFDTLGAPVYHHRGTERNFSPIEECQQGITAFIEGVIATDCSLLERVFDPDLAVYLYDLFSSTRCVPSVDVKKCFLFNDYYDPNQSLVSLL